MESQRVLVMMWKFGIEWFELFGFDGGGTSPAGGLYDGPYLRARASVMSLPGTTSTPRLTVT